MGGKNKNKGKQQAAKKGNDAETVGATPAINETQSSAALEPPQRSEPVDATGEPEVAGITAMPEVTAVNEAPTVTVTESTGPAAGGAVTSDEFNEDDEAHGERPEEDVAGSLIEDVETLQVTNQGSAAAPTTEVTANERAASETQPVSESQGSELLASDPQFPETEVSEPQSVSVPQVTNDNSSGSLPDVDVKVQESTQSAAAAPAPQKQSHGPATDKSKVKASHHKAAPKTPSLQSSCFFSDPLQNSQAQTQIKVIGAGWNGTGTHVLKKALRKLDFKTYSWVSVFFM